MVFLASLMIPGAVLVVPLFSMVRALGLLNTHEAIYLPGLISVFGIFLLRQAFLTIPRDLEDAAKLDGAGHLRILRDIYVPLSKPTLTTHALLVSQSVWKEFFWPNIVLSDMDKMTIPVGLVFLQGSYSFEAPSVIFAGVMLVSLPLVILFFFTQRFITQGIVRTGIRG
jgi:multiple sugar transport system permease protein